MPTGALHLDSVCRRQLAEDDPEFTVPAMAPLEFEFGKKSGREWNLEYSVCCLPIVALEVEE